MDPYVYFESICDRLLNEKLVRQAQLPLLCMVVPMGFMFHPYMWVIIGPLHMGKHQCLS